MFRFLVQAEHKGSSQGSSEIMILSKSPQRRLISAWCQDQRINYFYSDWKSDNTWRRSLFDVIANLWALFWRFFSEVAHSKIKFGLFMPISCLKFTARVTHHFELTHQWHKLEGFRKNREKMLRRLNLAKSTLRRNKLAYYYSILEIDPNSSEKETKK